LVGVWKLGLPVRGRLLSIHAREHGVVQRRGWFAAVRILVRLWRLPSCAGADADADADADAGVGWFFVAFKVKKGVIVS